MADDSVIIKKVLKGETQHFSELVEKYETRVYKTCYRFAQNEQDALDLCQEVFIKIYDNLVNFAGTKNYDTVIPHSLAEYVLAKRHDKIVYYILWAFYEYSMSIL